MSGKVKRISMIEAIQLARSTRDKAESNRLLTCDYMEASDYDRLLSLTRELAEAGQAMKIMMDRGGEPRKFDEALSWRANDEKAHKMMEDALAKAREEGVIT